MTSPKTLLRENKIYPKKQLGQSFLSDPSIAQAIVNRTNLLAHDVVMDIGAGLGALTIPAASIAGKVYAVEKDWKLAKILKNELLLNNLSNVEILENDILKMDFAKTAGTLHRKIIVMGNLPYYISSQVLIRLITSRNCIDRAILMFQKELAQRLAAQTGGKDYGRITVMLNYCSEIKALFNIEASAFFPKPRVDSQVLEIRFRDTPEYPAQDEAHLFSIIKAAFGKRRKTLKNALLKSKLGLDQDVILDVLKKVKIDPQRRAETLFIEEFVRLSNGLMQNNNAALS